MNKSNKILLLLTATSFLLVGSACVLSSRVNNMPTGALAISTFDIEKYKGTWYEIARMPMRFEKDLSNVTATYTLNDDGTVGVLNRGYHEVQKKWKQASGKAKFRGAANEAKLKVSFFGPFYAGYNVVALDSDYRYALVVGESTKYLWILSRTTTIPDEVKKAYLQKAKLMGYDISQLEWPAHDKQTAL